MSIVEKTLQRIRGQNRLVEASGRPGERVFGTVLANDAQRSPRPRAVVSGAASAPARRIAIDQDALRAAGLLPPAHQERQIAEQYRQIKRPLIVNAMGRGTTSLAGAQVVMLASALPGEGKTFTAVNLAFSMARERDISVLLVDADTPKPEISKLFGAAGSPGLLDVLQDDTLDVESVILPTDVPRLSLLPAGTGNENATELLASERMRGLVTRLGERDRHRIVLLDSPPLLLTTESRVLAALAGQVVLVVCAEYTAQQTVLDALSHLEGRAVALVLNQNVNAAPAGYYYHGYGETGNTRPESSG